MEWGKISIGPPWFEFAFAIPMLPLVFLIGVGMHTAWRSQAFNSLLGQLKIPAIVAIAAGIALPTVFYGRAGLMLIIGSIAGFWILAVSLIQPIRSWRRPAGTPGMTRSALGMSIAHFGVGMFTLGVTIVSGFTVETDQSIRVGETIEVAGYQFKLTDLQNVQGPNYQALEGEIEIRRNGEFVSELRPQKRTYLVQQSPMTEAGIDAGWNRDLFVALGDPLGNEAWSVRLQYKPLIRFIWLGAFIMALGGLVAASDRRYRLTATAPEKSREPSGETA
jgi:cytochrome c-type biogenesis protein CcmF